MNHQRATHGRHSNMRSSLGLVCLVLLAVAGNVWFLSENAWAQETSAQPQPGETRSFAGIEMVWITAGSFSMGSPANEQGRDSSEKQHDVTLTKGFWMGKCEVTNAQFDAFVKEAGYVTTAEKAAEKAATDAKSPKEAKKAKAAVATWRTPMIQQKTSGKWEDNPVVVVSWEDAKAYCDWLAKKTGSAYTLPTEAQWEYACRAGTTTPFSFGETITTDQANYCGKWGYPVIKDEAGKLIESSSGKLGDYRKTTLPVGSLKSNAWGLYDMHGNVCEWCQDAYGEYSNDAAKDPTGPASGAKRVLRGGSWLIDPTRCRSAYRLSFAPTSVYNYVGFRLVMTQ